MKKKPRIYMASDCFLIYGLKSDGLCFRHGRPLQNTPLEESEMASPPKCKKIRGKKYAKILAEIRGMIGNEK